jgi:hypothetical protein
MKLAPLVLIKHASIQIALRLFKKLENHESAVALHFMHYNAGYASNRSGNCGSCWNLEEIVRLLD